MESYKETVLVKGASGEIGAQNVRKLMNYRYQFILHYNDNDQIIKELINELDDDQLLAVIQADLSNDKGIKQFIDATAFYVDHIVFAQGIPHYELLIDTESRTIDQLYHIHVKSTMLISQTFLPSMIHRKKGNIIVVSSIWGEVGASNEVVYSAMKGAQNAFVKALAKEVGISGIRVNAISPGLIDTKMNDKLSEEEIDMWKQQIPLKRIGTVDDVAKVVKFLCSQDSKYIHGQIIRVNGGTI